MADLTLVEALEHTITALTGLTDEHAALVAHARCLAHSIDTEPTDAKLHSEYRQVLKALLAAGHPEDVDAFERLIKELAG